MIHNRWALYSMALLLPLAAAARSGKAPRVPGATLPLVAGTFTWKGTAADGTVYTITAPASLQIDTTVVPPPPPPPPPVDPVSISYVTGGPQRLSTGQSGSVTVVLTRAPLQMIRMAVKVENPLMTGPTFVDCPAGAMTATFPVQFPGVVTAEKYASVSVSYNGKSPYCTFILVPSVAPAPVISGVQDTFRVPVASAAAGGLVYIVGSGFGASGTVTHAGLPLTIVAWSPAEVRAALPIVALTTTAPLMLLPTGGSVASSAPFTVSFVAPPPPPPPPPGLEGGPTISNFLNPDGSPVVKPAYGQELRIVGQGFGTTAGRVVWNGGAVTVLSWVDGEIRVRLPLPVPPGPVSQFSVVRPDGLWHDLMLPLDLTAPVPGAVRGSARRR